jgi:GMP synthase-like glutamine amidotransferase
VRLGILETQILESGVKEKYGSYAEMFQRLFLSVDSRLEFMVYQVTERQYPESVDECDAYLITGSKSSVYDDEPWIVKLQDYVVSLHKQRKKLIGICFGHQLIAQALGGLAQKSENGWGVGNTVNHIKKTTPWMGNAKQQFSLLVSHQDQVTTLPADALLIASNEQCPNTSFQIGSHILAFQGHPEFSEDYLEYSMNKRRDLIGEEKYNKALDSLKGSQDSQLVAQWIINFIKMDRM